MSRAFWGSNYFVKLEFYEVVPGSPGALRMHFYKYIEGAPGSGGGSPLCILYNITRGPEGLPESSENSKQGEWVRGPDQIHTGWRDAGLPGRL